MSVIKPYRFYQKDTIERKANDILRRMAGTANFTPKWPFESSLVADFLDLGVVWDSIDPDEEGAIAARILPTARLIEINEDIQKESTGFIESTIAHEIGHWVLHINQDEADGLVRQLEINLGNFPPKIEEQPFVCRGSAQAKLASIEWQAQYFASCLLMPRHILEIKREGKDLTKWPHLYRISQELGVTISNLTNRLQDLGYIHIPKGSREIQRGSPVVNNQQQQRLFG